VEPRTEAVEKRSLPGKNNRKYIPIFIERKNVFLPYQRKSKSEKKGSPRPTEPSLKETHH